MLQGEKGQKLFKQCIQIVDPSKKKQRNLLLQHNGHALKPRKDNPKAAKDKHGERPSIVQRLVILGQLYAGGHQKYGKNLIVLALGHLYNQRYRDQT